MHTMWTVLLGVAVLLCLSQHVAGQKKMFCYYSSDARWRPSYGKFQPKDIDPNLCTHVIVAFAKVLPWGLGPNTAGDDAPSGWNALYKKTVALKRRNKDLRVLLAVGGWREGSEPFLPAIRDANSMDTWAAGAVRFLREHAMDGMDMDWEFPGVRGSQPDDKYKFTQFMETIQRHFKDESWRSGREKMVLTLATAAGLHFIEAGYEPEKIHRHVDYLLLMTYNYHGLWEQNVGHHSSIWPSRVDVGERRNLSQTWTVNYWKQAGAPNHKLILGLATYGMSYTLLNPSQTWLGANATGGGRGGRMTNEEGILAYFEICENLRNGWTSVWIPEQKSPYAFGSDQWVGYDNVQSIETKARFLNEQQLGGAFIWSVEMDDFTGRGCNQGKYPLLRKISEIIRPAGGVAPQPQPTWAPPPTWAPARPTWAPARPTWAPQPQPQPTRRAPAPPTPRPVRARPPGPIPSINILEPQSADGSFVCPQPGLHADPANCHMYYHCTDVTAFHMTCGPARAFDANHETCVHANKNCPIET